MQQLRIEDIDEDDIVWQPIPGSSQEIALASNCTHTLYHGTRGPGKTAAQLMKFRKLVGLGYGSYLRGIIFDREFKNLDDMVAQSKRFFHAFNDGARFLASASEYKWVWPTGEELKFSHVKKIEDYDGYHGHEYCLEENELLPLKRGNIPIKDVKIGDEIATIAGYKKITKVFNVGIKNGVKVSTYTLDGQLYSSQLQSEDHRLLTTEGWQNSKSCNSCQNVMIYNESFCQKVIEKTPLDGDCLRNKQIFCEQEYVEKLSIVFDNILQTVQLADFYSEFSLLQQELFQLVELHEPHLPNRHHELSKSCEKLRERMIRKITLSSDHSQLQELLSQLVDYHSSNLNVPFLDDLYEWYITEDYQYDFGYVEGLYGELFRIDTESAQYLAQQPHDVLNTIHYVMQGVREYVKKHIHHDLSVFEHPYRMDKLIRSNLELIECSVQIESYGEIQCYDIEVEDVNCYFTTNGLSNKNCFLGWNELTKYPTSDLYDKFMSTNRTSFDPIKHTPKKRDKKGNKIFHLDGRPYYDTVDGNPLPPIPLQVFSTTNPSGAGHNWVKKRFINVGEDGEIITKLIRVYNPKTKREEDVEITQIAIFGSYKENIYLDPVYIANLDEQCRKNPALFEAWMLGSWDITAGGALDDLWDRHVHVIAEFNIPDNWHIDRAYDWGSSEPFSIGWFAVSNGEDFLYPNGDIGNFPKGSIIQFNEWYGTREIGTNKGLGLGTSKIIEGIKSRESALLMKGKICKKPKPGPADTQINNKNDNDFDSIAKRMDLAGIKWVMSDKSNGSRVNGLQLIRDMLQSSIDKEGAGLYFCRNCVGSIETIPSLPRDPLDINDIDTTAEDHPYDMVRYRLLHIGREFATNINFKFV